MAVKTDVLIVGGGLAGLSIASNLAEQDVGFRLIEARNRFGGRIKTERGNGGYFDTGPAWFWHGQSRILSLIEQLGLEKFEQYSTGDLSYEDQYGSVQRGAGFSSMLGSLRLVGGLACLTDTLVDRLPSGVISLNCHLRKLMASDDGMIASVASEGKEATIVCKRVVLALPPRVAAEIIEFDPALPDEAVRAMENIPTWMAGQAKVIAIYNAPFWRDAGLSGDAMSHAGPLVEIHDASPNDGGPYALFGFVGVPVSGRSDQTLLKELCLRQLGRLFNEEALKPKELILKDWAQDPLTATPSDHAPPYSHPNYGLPHSMHRLMDGKLLFGSTEVAPQFGGYLEGALEAAEVAASTLLQQCQPDAPKTSASIG